MAREFSPGPWRFGTGEDWGYILDANGRIVAGGAPHEGCMADDKDDDVLMCAAPELLDVLRRLFQESVADAEGCPNITTMLEAKRLMQRLDQK